MNDILETLADIQRRLRRLEFAGERPVGVTIGGAGAAGQVTVWDGSATLGTAGYAGTAVARTNINNAFSGSVAVGTAGYASGYRLTVNGKVNATAINVGDSDLTVFQESTWSPTITGSSTDPGTLNFTTQAGSYVRIDDTVFFHFTLVIGTITGGSGNARFSLPLTAVNNAGLRPISSVLTSGVAWPAGAQQVVFRPTANAAYGNLTGVQGNAAVTTVTIADLAAGDTISVSGFYFV